MCELRPRTSLTTVVVAHSLDTGGGVVPNTARGQGGVVNKSPVARDVRSRSCPWPRTWTALRLCRARARAPRAHKRRSCSLHLASGIDKGDVETSLYENKQGVS